MAIDIQGPTTLTDADRIVIRTGASNVLNSSASGQVAAISSGNVFVWAERRTRGNVFVWVEPRAQWGMVSTFAAKPAWLQAAIERLTSLVRLEPGLDSYRAKSIDPQRAQQVLSALLEVMKPETPLPSIVPTTDGGIQLEWHRNGIDLEIEPVSPNRIEYYVRKPDGTERAGEWTYNLSELHGLIRDLQPA